MSFLIVAAKVFATLFLVALFIAGIFNANSRTHDPTSPPIAEYAAGFMSS